jgi:hypothetical protein
MNNYTSENYMPSFTYNAAIDATVKKLLKRYHLNEQLISRLKI